MEVAHRALLPLAALIIGLREWDWPRAVVRRVVCYFTGHNLSNSYYTEKFDEVIPAPNSPLFEAYDQVYRSAWFLICGVKPGSPALRYGWCLRCRDFVDLRDLYLALGGEEYDRGGKYFKEGQK